MKYLDQTPASTLTRMKRRVMESTDADRPTTLAMMRMISEEYLPWPFPRVTRRRVHNVLQELGFYQSEDTGFWYTARPILEPTPYNLLKEAVGVIESLAEQQAMPDDWYEEPVARFKKALEKMRPGA